MPYVGAFAGGLPPFVLALADSGPQQALLDFVVYVLVQQIEGNSIVPEVMARAVDLHPAVVLVGVVVGQLFGLLGLVVAVPIVPAVVILIDELWVKRFEEQNPPPAPTRDGGLEEAAREVRMPEAVPGAGSRGTAGAQASSKPRR